jgi:uncharacterized protein (TIGR03435 family)
MHVRRAALVGLVAVASAVGALAQSPQPSFEVASVKENTSVSNTGGTPRATPGRLRITNTPLRFVLLDAFHVMDHQLIGAPEWTESARFDIIATSPTTATEQDTRLMLQTLLADRFGLRTHQERRELPMYALVLTRTDGSLGPQLVRSTVDCEKWIAEKRPQVDAGGPSPVAPGGKRPACMLMTTRRFITGGTRTISQLAASLQALTGRPVVDRTGLTGTFDMDLQWTSGTITPPVGAAAAPDDGPSIFTALQEQLGLKLESTRGPFEVVVIDSIHRPTPD